MRRHGRVLQVHDAAVGEADAAARRDPADGEIRAAEPAGVVMNPAAVQLHTHRGNHQLQLCHVNQIVKRWVTNKD